MLTEEALQTIGANGYVFRRCLLEHVSKNPYFFDIDVMHQSVRAGIMLFAFATALIVPVGVQAVIGFCRKPDRAWL